VVLRHDIELLSDAGILRTPMTAWPLSWPDIARDALAATLPAAQRDEYLDAVLARVQRAARSAAALGSSGVELEAAGAAHPMPLRTFSATPREQGEISAGASWLGERLAAAAHVTVVADASDHKPVRLDGSYLGLTLGNFMVSVGAVERWWGPGWEGSLILSDNARPMPGITLERNYSDASPWPVLKWFGPWRASIALAEADRSDVAVPDSRFLAARITFKPRPWAEIGLSRTAQWCGQGRPCGFGPFRNLLLGRDNANSSLTRNDEPGNQMAGYDLRLRSPWARLPVALYGQFIGEDEAGGLPSKFLGLLGAEVWGGAGNGGSWRVHLEYADTACEFTRSHPSFNCAYRNALYPQGYTYLNRIIGHSMDNDGRMISLGGLWVRASGEAWSVLLREVDLNRDGLPDPSHRLSPAGRSKLANLELAWQKDLPFGRLKLGVGYDDYSQPAGAGSTARGFAQFQRNL
jgi:hypothetical protein